jgi:hypothetical protein
MREDDISLLWKFIIILCAILALHMLITWGALGALSKTNSRLDALEQHCGYALDKDAP